MSKYPDYFRLFIDRISKSLPCRETRQSFESLESKFSEVYQFTGYYAFCNPYRKITKLMKFSLLTTEEQQLGGHHPTGCKRVSLRDITPPAQSFTYFI